MTEIIIREMTEEEITEREAWAAAEPARLLAEIQEARRNSYQRDADPLYFGYQRGDNTEQDWLDAVQAVKDTYPYPEAPVA